MEPDIKKLLKIANEEDRLELIIFQNAVKKNLKEYNSSPIKKNKNNLDAARDSLSKKKEEMVKKYLKPEQGEHVPSFPSMRAVVKHLDQVGFKVSKSKLSRDKTKNLIRVNPDGSVPESEVRAYAATLERKDGTIDDLNDIHARKTEREVKSLDLKIEKQEFELGKEKGQYIPRRDFEAELAARAVILETGLKHLYTTRVGEWIALVVGKPEKAPDLLQALYHSLEEELSGYATTRIFQVMFLEDR